MYSNSLFCIHNRSFLYCSIKVIIILLTNKDWNLLYSVKLFYINFFIPSPRGILNTIMDFVTTLGKQARSTILTKNFQVSPGFTGRIPAWYL